MKQNILNSKNLLTSILLGVVVSSASHGMNWNGKNASSLLDTFDGEFEVDSGHPLATKNAFVYFQQMIQGEKNKKRQDRWRVIVRQVLGEDPLSPTWGTKNSQVLQQVIFGSWMNEVKVNIDASSDGTSRFVTHEKGDAHYDASKTGLKSWFVDPMKFVSKGLAFIFKSNLENYKHSFRYGLDTLYTSANYLHAMEVTSIDAEHSPNSGQLHTFNLIEEYVGRSVIYAVVNLGIAGQATKDGSLSKDEIKNLRTEAFTMLGSIFHLLEDSTISCTKSAQAFLKTAKGKVKDCVIGDGHTVYENIRGRPRIVTLSDNSFYETRHDYHAALDDNYRPDRISKVFVVDGFNLDPARMTTRILREVVWGANTIKQYTSKMGGSAKEYKDRYPRVHSLEIRKKNERFDYDGWMMSKAGAPKGKIVQEKILDELFAKHNEEDPSKTERKPMPKLP